MVQVASPRRRSLPLAELHILKDTTSQITCWMWPAIHPLICSKVEFLRVLRCGVRRMEMARWRRGTRRSILSFGTRQAVLRTLQLS